MSLTHADRRGCERYQSASSGVKDCGQQSGSGRLLYLLTFCCYQLEDMLLPLCICVQSHTFTHNSPPHRHQHIVSEELFLLHCTKKLDVISSA